MAVSDARLIRSVDREIKRLMGDEFLKLAPARAHVFCAKRYRLPWAINSMTLAIVYPAKETGPCCSERLAISTVWIRLDPHP